MAKRIRPAFKVMHKSAVIAEKRRLEAEKEGERQAEKERQARGQESGVDRRVA